MPDMARVGNHLLTVCPFCDQLFERSVDDDSMGEVSNALLQDYRNHLDSAPSCGKKNEALPSISDWAASMRPYFEAAENERQRRIDDNPDNGRTGYWRVEGIRHEATTKASMAAEAIEKCREHVGDWESSEATFIGEELPEVF